MAVPKVFISSTCYDLAEERAQLERFVSSYGFQPILSEFNDVFFNPDEHTHESCVKEVVNCDLFILVISGRFGGKYIKGTGESITQAEYNEARKQKIPIFAFVKGNVLEAQLYYKENIKTNDLEFANKINYPAITKQSDSESIFKFIESVQRASENNAIESYTSFTEIENHLRKQWAGLFYNFLQKRKDQREVEHISSILDRLSGSSAKLESLVESLHTKQFTEEETKELISKSEIRVNVDIFFSTLKDIVDEVILDFDDKFLTLEIIDTIVDCNANEYKSFYEYLNASGFIKVLYNEIDVDIIFTKDEIQNFSMSSNSVATQDLADSFYEGVRLASKSVIKEYIVEHFKNHINLV